MSVEITYISLPPDIDLEKEKKEQDTSIKIADEKEMEIIKDYYRKKDFYAARLSVYDDTIFEEFRGSWDLYSFVGLEEKKLDKKDGSWYKVKGLYARNPADDVASRSELAAIDFGTMSTTVAVLDNSGYITLMPVGAMENLGYTAFENPTIIEFKDIRQFMEEYGKLKFSPDTKFDHVSVSYPALDDYEKPTEQTGIQMRQYMNHLKQWVNNPVSMLDVIDGKGVKFGLEYGGSAHSKEELNPIEIYAYYIGRNINNMHHQKVYLKYLLSYTSTYTEKKKEWIRVSFEKGLRKSLPPQVGNDKELMKQFEVKLGCDEATAYAVSALRRYMEEDYRQNEKDSIYMSQLEKGGIFYGVYDFGGGTLDFSFGVMNKENEQDVFRQLKYGGSSHLGCENLLEELAFEIFYREGNRNILWKNNIKCVRPFDRGRLQHGYQIVGCSNAARFNTSSMIAYLRAFWINGKKGQAIYLQNEKGVKYQAELKGNDHRKSEEKTTNIELQISNEEIERFFCEKVTKGIRLFVHYYKEVIRKNEWLGDKLCFLFLAGKASYAKRVEGCFYEELKENGLTEHFSIKRPLPTESDKKQYQGHSVRSIPMAKSGVVFGLLRSRPEGMDVIIVDETPKVNFQYHIGLKKMDMLNIDNGLFQLLLSAEEITLACENYQLLMEIPKKSFSILYTSDGEYALSEALLPVGDGVKLMTIQVPECYIGSFLYVRAKADSTEVLECGVSNDGRKYQNKVKKIGVCDFSNMMFRLLDE